MIIALAGLGRGRRIYTRCARICLCLLLLAVPLAARAATNSVTNLNDSGPGSLRQVIAEAAPGATISFAVTGTILLNSGSLNLDQDVTIDGPGAASLTLSGGQGSRILKNTANVTIMGLTLTNGDADPGGTNLTGNGGAILSTGALTLTDSIVTGNHAFSGGGIYSSDAALTIVNSTVSNNNGDGDGAGVYNGRTGALLPALLLIGSTISGNSAKNDGGGLANFGSATITNSTISGNSAKKSAGGILSSGTLLLSNATIAGNAALSAKTGTIGGIWVLGVGSTATMRNTILAANSVPTSSPDCIGTIISAGYNILGSTNGCTFASAMGDQFGNGANPIDPQLGPLQDNGGPTQTQAPVPGSPAIDAGNPSAPGSGGAACAATDQRGAARPAFGASSATCDIGAVEVGGVILLASNNGPTLLGQPTTLSANGLGPGFQYHWDFGDGAAADGNPITHSYTSTGTFPSSVTAISGTTTYTATTLVFVNVQAPDTQHAVFLALVQK